VSREQEPRVSVLIANYNYERFLRDAVESALAQAYPRVEIVVVDDGSTDSSREILAGYGDRIVTVLKANGGHASAINAGVARCRGELVALLDSDDVFLPGKIERVVRAYRQSPRAVLVHHRLRTMDALGMPRGFGWPHDVWTGDVRERAARAGGWWPRPTTSAMTFTRSFLERILPMREDSEPGRAIWPDAYAGDLAPFFGEIIGIPETLAHYRVHGNNSQLRFDAEKQLRQIEFEHRQVREALARLGRPDSPASIDHHLAYLESACGRRPGVSVGRVLSAIFTCPGLSAEGRLYTALRVVRAAVERARRRERDREVIT
jgi:glycosyltransferase involved in cell wall biosynthesis